MTRVLVLDEITVKPGLAAEFRLAHRNRYLPGALGRGMKLEGAWQNPPERDLPELPTTLYYLWSLEDVDAWWRMRLSRTADGGDERFVKHAFWQEADRLTMSRRRTVLSDQPTED
ncbi:hypothetical protein [Trujillonella endophytica]|uniref:NIPSNAP protein n=1 Tax=Trujillonella endophytica TaxID=673521 RepID=A0A1H8Q5T4_9ACTN|nr:hypothetical protein [Trujillella endophytica]SEO49436.1 hypothetical protein SAMN05660991_00582 [Trujillella endophytica]